MKIIKFSPLFLLFIFCVSLIPLFTQQEVVLSIREGMPAIPVACPSFHQEDNHPLVKEAAQTLRDILLADLRYSRVFIPLPESYYQYVPPLNPQNIQFKNWESIQAKLLFVGSVSQGEKKNSVVLEGKIYDVKSQRFILGRKYNIDPSLLRLAAHKMADELMKLYGEPPLFTSKIVFVSNRDGNDEIYLMDYDGQNQVRLTYNRVRDYMPAWAPDRKKIAYTSFKEGQAILYILDLEQGKLTTVQNEGTNFAPAFSPDGKKLAFCSTLEEGNSEIYVAQSNGTKIRRLTFNKAIDTAPTWSPTSREIAFTSDRSGTPQIYIMDAEGTNIRHVSFGGNYHDAPAWAPTGERLAYVSRVNLIFDLYILNLRTNQIIKLTESNARNESPAWSPDGRHLVFSSNRKGTIQIFSIDYDGTNLRQLTFQGENKLPDWSK
ncbi:MAG: Tol-Pal system beta propeller repeat protein TolB [Candidatus Aminicenantes bacterium]|nr:MAG: Tol-Pal system beta propeller repeat protein TolB [Candidatus Aminicenantes bacterium]